MRCRVRFVCLAVCAIVLAPGCKQLFGTYNSVVDPGASAYQGYATVSSANDVAPVSPADAATLSYLVLSCLPCSTADVYGIQIAASAEDFEGTKVYQRLDFTTNTMELTDASIAAGTYQWRVRAHARGGDWGSWSASRSIVLDTDYGTLWPADGGSTMDTTPLLDWGDVTGAGSYEMQFADSSAGVGSATVVAASSSEYQVPLTGKFAYGQSCYWRVRALNGEGVPAAWSVTFSATISWDVTYTTVSPADGGSSMDTTPLLNWDDVAGASSFEVQFADSAAGVATATTVAASTSEYQVPLTAVFAYGDEVFWRLRAVNADGVAGPWTPTRSFRVQWTVDYGTVSPADGATIYDSTPVLNWADVTGAASYEVQYADSVAGLASATPMATNVSEYQVPTALAYCTWYCRVRAVNEDLVPAPWSATWHFAPLLTMASVAGGTFEMGSTAGQPYEQPVHTVTVSTFLISRYEVTQAQYQTVMGTNPSYFASGADAPVHPVERVSWDSAVAFCDALSALEGLEPFNGVDLTRKGYRLPTEAEWEFAARGGAVSQGYTYAGSDDVNAVAWWGGFSTFAVGGKQPNELGIYDMSGNVCEWCWDWYALYDSSAQQDPTGPPGPTGGWGHVTRGGSAGHGDPSPMRSAARSTEATGTLSGGLGFRVVRRLD